MNVICNLLFVLVAAIPFLWAALVYKAVKNTGEKFVVALITVVWIIVAYLLGFILANGSETVTFAKFVKPCEYLNFNCCEE